MVTVTSSSPKFSILLPTHNRAEVISYAIESVFAQTQDSFELLIVGDGCTDGTAIVARDYLTDKRVKWFDLPKGPGFGYANRNEILKESTGNYIAFMAHDDIIFPDHLEILEKYLDENQQIDLVYSRPLWVNSKGLILPSCYNIQDPTIFEIFMTQSNGIPASCVIHRRSCFEEVGYWDDSLPAAADWDLWKRIIRSKDHINYAFESRPTTFHFKAIWKEENQTWPVGLNTIVPYVEENRKIVPDSLHMEIPENQLEQKIFWEKIRSSPQWLKDIRKDVTNLIDRIVQIETPIITAKISQFHSELERERRKVADVQANFYKLEDQIRKLEGSFFFKLRKLLLKIIPNGSSKNHILCVLCALCG